MIKIANIIHESELVNHDKRDYINYYNEPITYDDLDHTLPTLYVGWNFMRCCNLDNLIIKNANILHKKIIKNELYWEFSFMESKPSHVSGIELFVEHAPEFYFIKYNYINLDPVFFQIATLDNLFDIIPLKLDKVYTHGDKMLYLQKENTIWGIDLEMYKFFNFNIELILELTKAKANTVFEDSDTTLYQKYYHFLPEFPPLKRYIITLV